MREKLEQYVDLLFAGAANAEDVKQEILQNTLDRYDDLIAQGKTPQAAYSISISGIGDIHEILSNSPAHQDQPQDPPTENPKDSRHKLIQAAAIMFFILCPIPVLILGDIVGVCLLLAMVATGVGLLVFYSKDTPEPEEKEPQRSPLHKTLLGIVWGCGITFYLVISLITHSWEITWLVFLITFCTCGLINACFDLNKTFLSALIRCILFVILICLLIVAFLGVCLGYTAISFIENQFEMPDGTVSRSGTANANEVTRIQVDWVGGNVTVKTGDVESIEFSESAVKNPEHQMAWSVSGQTLEIQFCKSSISLFNSIPDKDLTMVVPEDWYFQDFDINGVSADMDISDLSGKELDIVSVSGVCRLENCAVEDFSGDTVSGSIQFAGTAASADLNTVSADCTMILSGVPREMDLESVSGDLILLLPESCGFTADVESVSGVFTSDFPTTQSKDRHVFGDGRSKISAETVSGNLEIRIAA